MSSEVEPEMAPAMVTVTPVGIVRSSFVPARLTAPIERDREAERADRHVAVEERERVASSTSPLGNVGEVADGRQERAADQFQRRVAERQGRADRQRRPPDQRATATRVAVLVRFGVGQRERERAAAADRQVAGGEPGHGDRGGQALRTVTMPSGVAVEPRISVPPPVIGGRRPTCRSSGSTPLATVRVEPALIVSVVPPDQGQRVDRRVARRRDRVGGGEFQVVRAGAGEGGDRSLVQ